MAYYEKFEFFIPKGPSEASEKETLRAFLLTQFRKSAAKKYGGSTGWNPEVPGLLGEWRQGRKTVPDELITIWILVDAAFAEEALEDLTLWKERFEQAFGEKFILVTHFLISTIGSLKNPRCRTKRRRSFTRRKPDRR